MKLLKICQIVIFAESLIFAILLFSVGDIPCTIAGLLMLIACISILNNMAFKKKYKSFK